MVFPCALHILAGNCCRKNLEVPLNIITTSLIKTDLIQNNEKADSLLLPYRIVYS